MEHDLVFMHLNSNGNEVHVEVHTVQHISETDRGGSFIGLANGQFVTVDETPREVLEQMHRMISEVPF